MEQIFTINDKKLGKNKKKKRDRVCFGAVFGKILIY
jgi:hypothetical protein